MKSPAAHDMQNLAVWRFSDVPDIFMDTFFLYAFTAFCTYNNQADYKIKTVYFLNNQIIVSNTATDTQLKPKCIRCTVCLYVAQVFLIKKHCPFI